jgi:hypothetical protein
MMPKIWCVKMTAGTRKVQEFRSCRSSEWGHGIQNTGVRSQNASRAILALTLTPTLLLNLEPGTKIHHKGTETAKVRKSWNWF